MAQRSVAVQVRAMAASALLGLSLLLVGCGGETEPQPVVAQPQERQQIQTASEQQVQQVAQPEPDEQQVQQTQLQSEEQVHQQTQPQPIQQAAGEGFSGESTQTIERFTGETVTTLSAIGDGDFPYSGLLALSCTEGDLRLLLDDFPLLDYGPFALVLEYVTSNTIGSPRSVRMVINETVDGNRVFERDGVQSEDLINGEMLDSESKDPLIRAIVTSTEISFRIPPAVGVFVVTFDIGDISQAEHWDDLVACDGTAE